MSYHVLQPPTDGEAFKTLGKEIFDASRELGMTLDAEGFLFAWVNGTRVIAERDATGKIIGLALLAVGKRWHASDFTASLLEMKSPDMDGMMDFAKQMCAVMGASSLFADVPGAGFLPTLVARVIQSRSGNTEYPDEAQVAEDIAKVMKLDYPAQTIYGVLEFKLT